MKAIWNGTIAFGLVNIPIKLYPASIPRQLNFDLLRKQDNCPVGYVRVCKTTGEEVPYEDVVKGFEYEKGRYVVLTDEDFNQANVSRTSTMEVIHFTDETQIEPKFFQKPYYVEPEQGAERLYAVFREALKMSGKVGVVTYVLKNKEYLGIVKPEGDLIMIVQLRYATEVVPVQDLAIPLENTVPPAELNTAVELIDRMSEPFNPDAYTDAYTQELMATIEEKAKGQVRVRTRGKKPEATPQAQLLERLRQSLRQAEVRPFP